MNTQEYVTKGAVYGAVIVTILLAIPYAVRALDFAPVEFIAIQAVYLAMLIPIGLGNACDVGIAGWLDIEVGAAFPPVEFIALAVGVYVLIGAAIGYIYAKTR